MVRTAYRFVIFGMLLPVMSLATTNSRAADTVKAGPAKDFPCCLVLVLDTSGSMEEDRRLERLKGSTSALVVSLPEGSLVGVVTFNHEARVLVPLTRVLDSKRNAVLDPVHKLRAEGGTDILAGLGKGIELLAATGGTVVLVSDGLQTGQGDKPLPESVWGKSARGLARRAKERGITVHTIGLGPEVEADPLLRLLAGEAGGQFFGVRKAEDLVSQFVGLAGQIGRHWRRSEAGDFVVAASSEDVIQVVAKGAKPQLFRKSDGKLVPLDPIYRVERSGVRAERFRLPRGSYRFEPEGAGRSDLLRPMHLSWTFPAEPKLWAGRNTELLFQAKPDPSGPASPKDLVLSVQLRYGQQGKPETIKAPVGEAGRFVVPLKTPARLEPVTATLEAEQRGWHCRVGTLSGRLVLPAPLEVTLQGPEGKPLEPVTRGGEKEASFQIEAICATPGQPLDLVVSVSDPRLRVSPSRVRLDKPRQPIRFALSCEPKAGEPLPLLEASLRFGVEAEDLVQPRLNGGREVEWGIRWRHLRPSLRLHGLPSAEQEFVTSRGGELLLPVTLEGTDLERKAGVQLSAGNVPGFRLDWVDRANGVSKPVPVLEPIPRAAPALRVAVGKEVSPGRHVLEFSTRSSDPGVPLNQAREATSWKVVVVVGPVDVSVRLLEGTKDWSVLAPAATTTRKVQVEIAAADGGPLPPLEMDVTAVGPIGVAVRERTAVSVSRLRAGYELSVAGQTAPFEGAVRFCVRGPQVRCAHISVVPVSVRPVVLQVRPGAVELPRYPGTLERFLGWLRAPSRQRLNVEIDGEGWAEARCSWKVVARRPGGSEAVVQPGEAEQMVWVAGTEYELVVSSAYEHTRFRPSSRVPILVRESTVAVPGWIWLLVGGLPALLAVAAFRPWPVKVCLQPGGVYRGFRRLRLGRLLGRPTLGLTLTRGLLGSSRLARAAKGPDTDTVVLVSPDLSQLVLLPGESCPIHRGDVIDVTAPDGRVTQIEVLSGRAGRSEGSKGEAILSPDESPTADLDWFPRS